MLDEHFAWSNLDHAGCQLDRSEVLKRSAASRVSLLVVASRDWLSLRRLRIAFVDVLLQR